jgi:hypothetical protein
MPDGKVTASAAEHAVSDAAVNSKQQSTFVWMSAISRVTDNAGLPVGCRSETPNQNDEAAEPVACRP